jgi:hypothetical protein
MSQVVVSNLENTLPPSNNKLETAVIELTDTVVVSNDTPQVVVTGLMGPAAKQKLFRYVYPPSLQWVVTHNNNTNRFVKRLVDLEGNEFFAHTKVTSNNEFVVYLTEAIAGYVDVFFDEQALGEIYGAG